MAEQQERAVSGKIEAKVYLRYSNEVPSAINNAFAMGEFGPSGNDKPYFTVTVDLDELNKKVNSYSYWQDYGRGNWVEYIYYSIDSDSKMESAKYETGKCYKIMAGSNYFSHECSRSGKVHQCIW